jgi:outer membrane PBP1 activator LpoA protein
MIAYVDPPMKRHEPVTQAQGSAPPPQVAGLWAKATPFAQSSAGRGRSPDPALHKKLAALAAVTLVLVGCAGVPRGPAPSAQQAASLAHEGNLAGAAQIYEALANGSSGAQRNDFALQAAQAFLQAQRPDDAGRALELLSPPLSGAETFDRSLLQVRLAAERGQAARAWALVQAIPAPTQPDQASRYLRLRQQVAFAAGQPVAGIEAEIQLEHWLLNAAAVQQSRVALLDALRDSVERGIKLQPSAERDPVVRGWLEVGPLAAEAAHNPTTATADLTAWLSGHPGHPAVGVVRSELLGEQPQPLGSQAHIALLLPITGAAGPLAVSVRDGFLTAFYQTPMQQRPVVRVYDTSAGQSIPDAISAATQGGADIIVGPLTRQAVAAAAEDRLQRPPLLALNFLPDGEQAPPLFFQFALSPVEEARLVARRILSDGHHLGIAIVPAGDWGSRVLAAFTQQLAAGGGTVIASTMIDLSQSDYSDEIQQVLRIDQSRERLGRLESLLGTHLEFVPRRRDDIQFIFAPAPAAAERQLQPQLRFFYAAGIPAYATSDAFEPDPRANQDLDGLMFPEMPWMLGSPLADAVRSAAGEAWPAGGPARGRLFAFGFDAYRIAQALREKGAPSSLDLSGLTGELTLEPDGHVHRQLIWAQLHDGEVRQLPSSPGS